MKNIIGLSVLVILFSSCGLFFIEGANDKTLSTLALTGGGYLSTDDHNEICPYIYRPETGETYLFFSSDRQGSYDIYFTKMDAHGDFSAPVPLTNYINSNNSQELFPLVFYDNGYADTALTILRVTGTVTNIWRYLLELNFDVKVGAAPQRIDLSPKGIGILKSSGHLLLLSYGNSVVTQINNMGLGMWDIGYPYAFNLLGKANSANALYLYITNDMDLYIKDTVIGGKHQIAAEGIIYAGPDIPLVVNTSIYQSKFNDITPFIDQEGGFKVYFASDRYGKGNFDLYRYNLYTYNKLPEIAQVFSWDTLPPEFGMQFPTNNETVYGLDIMVQVTNNENIIGTSVTAVFCSLDNGDFLKMFDNDGTWQHYFLNAGGGYHSIGVYSMDIVGNFSKTNWLTIYLEPIS